MGFLVATTLEFHGTRALEDGGHHGLIHGAYFDAHPLLQTDHTDRATALAGICLACIILAFDLGLTAHSLGHLADGQGLCL